MPRKPLSSIDTAWLRMEHPTHPMAITAVLGFGVPLDLKRLRGVFAQRLLRFARFRKRVVADGAAWETYYWEDDPHLDLDYHLQRLVLPPPGDQAALQGVVGDLMSRQLDLSRPLWQFHLAEGYHGSLAGSAGDGCALVGRVHHCLADGPTLMRVLHGLADPDPGAPQPAAGPEEAPYQALAARIVEMLVQAGLETFANPLRLLSLARLGSDVAASLRKMVLRPPDPKTVFRGELGSAKRVAWSAPVALADAKAIGRMVRGTVNDAMLAAITGALRRYLQRRGQSVDGVAIRGGLSVNLRPPGAEGEAGNQVGAVLVTLPIGTADPLARLRKVKQHMAELKDSPEASVVYGLLNALGMSPPGTQDLLVDLYCSRDSAVIANVPGPTEPICLAGAPLQFLVFWVPAFGCVGLGLNIISYAGQVWLGVSTDRRLVPDPETIAAEFCAEFEALLALTGPMGREHAVERMSAELDQALEALETMLQTDGSGN